ncbi:MAG: 3',5'-cyclic-nucleotide phosphodiesterase [Azoarcus sp.]|jgi:3',5'-cyclic-nucleotide phosphodiesterase|nr:3',5'-cyclic-nucleotide phosphodiesterase [Azoarcus sp.]
MKLTVLGCSGGIGEAESRTSAFLLDDDILLDCGTGVGDLFFSELQRINHVFLTHSHLDHIAALPLLVDAIGESCRHPITLYALPETLHILRAHVLNWLVWPDFTAIPNRNHPWLRLQPIQTGESINIGERIITALPALHTVPAAAWCVDSGQYQLIYSGDTTYSPELIAAINSQPALAHLIVETAFPEDMRALAMAARHICPGILALMLDEITASPEVHITHLKPGFGARIMKEIDALPCRLRPSRLTQGRVLEF